jgi:diacylglycerol kinase (ATP)
VKGPKFLFINPIAGGKKKNQLRKNILDLASKRPDIETHITEARGDIRKSILNTINEQDDACFFICGGDGTVQEAATALKGSNSSLIIIPCGSGDGFAGNAGFKNYSAETILKFTEVQKKPVDCYVINGETGVNMCGFGFDAEIAKLFAANKGRGWAGYVTLIIARLFSSGEQVFKIQFGEQTVVIKSWILGIANGAEMGNGAIVNPRGRIDDGILELYSIRKPGWHQIFPLLFRLFRGTLDHSPLYSRWRGKKFIVESPSKLAHIDGEPYYCESGIFEVEIMPDSLQLRIPDSHEKKQG